VSLAPADLKKEGSLYDLPIALGYLLANKNIKLDPKSGFLSANWLWMAAYARLRAR